MKEQLRAGDTLVVWRRDRLARSLKDLISWVALRQRMYCCRSCVKQSACGVTACIFRVASILHTELSAEMKSSQTLYGCDVFPECHDDLLERQLTVGKDRPGCHGKLVPAPWCRASETPTANAIWIE